MLGKGFFLTESHNPDLPPEEWTEVSTHTTAGAYSDSLAWGKYKIILSGAGGGGAAAGWTDSSGTRYAENGYNGEEKTIYVNVDYGNTLAISGIIGAGGGGAFAYARNPSPTGTGGTGGSGYQNGTNGNIQVKHTQHSVQPGVIRYENAATSGGGGGGSTSVEWNSEVQGIAKGGNGGTARQSAFGIWGYGGTGGSGGITNGTGVSGGTGNGRYTDDPVYSNAGLDGYVKIYVSNLKPGQY